MIRLGYVRHFFLVLTSLTYLIIMIDGYSLGRVHPTYVSDDDYYNYFDFNESRASAATANQPVLLIGERRVEDGTAYEQIKSSESNIKLKKKNSEIISALMGLRKAMSRNYGVGSQIHN